MQHVIESGVIVAPRGQWSYTDFVVDTVRAIQAPLFLLNLVKLLAIASQAEYVAPEIAIEKTPQYILRCETAWIHGRD